jgi:hypothetical protein
MRFKSLLKVGQTTRDVKQRIGSFALFSSDKQKRITDKQPIGWNPDLNDGDRINDHCLSLAEKSKASDL